MALLLTDGFDYLGAVNTNVTDGLLQGKWTSASSNWQLKQGRNGYGLGLFWTAGGMSLTSAFASAKTSYGWGCGAYFAPNGLGQTYFYFAPDSYLSYDLSNQRIQFICPAGTYSSPIMSVPIYTWVFLEAKVTLGSSGSVVVRYAGNVILSETGIETSASSGSNQFEYYVYSATGIDDFYLFDETGSSPYNDFLGDSRVYILGATADGETNNWTPVGATPNWQCVTNVLPVTDSIYVADATVGDVDLYVPQALPDTVQTVWSVNVIALTRKDDSNTRTLALGVGNGTATNFDAGQPVDSGYKIIVRPLAINPLTSAVWGTSDFATLQYGVKLIA